MITHRCNRSLEHKISIRYQKPYKWIDKYPVGWQLYYLDYSSEWDSYCLSLAARNIKYCPYCGEKLREREHENNL